MAIYRGPGGSGDATTDATNQASVASNAAAAASASQTAAANSATSAATDATNAANSATAAASSASSAATSASTATTQASNASTSASNASTSASNAATSETNATASATLANDWATKTSGAVAGGEYSAKYHAQAASTSASNASTSASNAATSASNASTSASNASSSASSAASSASSAAAVYDQFDDRYLGNKSIAPTLDNDGNALLEGALYWNTSDKKLYIYNGTSWDLTAGSGGGAGSVTSVALSAPTGFSVSGSPITTSGTLNLTFSSGYALPTTSSQSNWDTAYGWGNHASAGYALNSNIGVTIQGYDADLAAIAALSGTSGLLKKTAANTWTLDTNTYLTSYTETDPIYTASSWYSTTNNASNWNTAYSERQQWDGGSTNLVASTGRTSLGVTATGSDTTYAYRANNLSDLASASTARTNLGLGTIATLAAPSGTVVGTTDIQTLTNKTLTSPIISSISNTGTLTLPTSTDTLVGRATTDTLTNKTLTSPILSGTTLNDGFTEEVYAIVDAAGVAISPTNGSIQTWTLGASRTPTAGTWSAGQSITLLIDDGTAYTITWTTLSVTWVGGSAPTLATSGYTVVELWKVGSTIYGALVGNVA